MPLRHHSRVGRPRRMALKTFIEAVREGLREEMLRDENVIVLGEDVGKKGGVFLATDGLWTEFGDERVIDTPLSESQIIGTSIGAAIGGLRPVAEIQFADFIHPAFNQLVSEAARLRYRSNNGYGAPMVVRAPYGGGVHGALYHSQSVEAFYTHVPGLKVVIPSTPYDAKGLPAPRVGPGGRGPGRTAPRKAPRRAGELARWAGAPAPAPQNGPARVGWRARRGVGGVAGSGPGCEALDPGDGRRVRPVGPV